MGKVIMSGIVPLLTKPSTGILASSLAVGSVVKLMEGGTAVDYLVVNQGIPENSSLYDSSCNGTWLLRKDVHSKRQWNSSDTGSYNNCSVNTWLNSDFFNALGRVEQAVIKQVKIPYYDYESSGVVESGANGLSCKIFLLGGCEIGFTTDDAPLVPVDGAKLSYFESGTSSSAMNKRIAYLNGSVTSWWLRSLNTDEYTVWNVSSRGDILSGSSKSSLDGVRPVLILPSTAKFDETTMILKGAA